MTTTPTDFELRRSGDHARSLSAMSIASKVFNSRSAEQTCEIAANFAVNLAPGDIVLLSGNLGSGKTTFVRCACRALGVTQPVTSPTFTIGSVYGPEPGIAHLDMYRLAGAPDDVAALLADYLSPDRITFIEWPDAVDLAGVEPAAWIELEHAGGDSRVITIDRR